MLNMNKFCFHLYAQKSLFIGKNCNAFWLLSEQPYKRLCWGIFVHFGWVILDKSGD